MVVSGVAVLGSLWAFGFSSNLPILYGLATSLVTFVGGSLLTEAPRPEKLREWTNRLRSAPSID
jgi:SSS family solute:Na+ symporter